MPTLMTARQLLSAKFSPSLTYSVTYKPRSDSHLASRHGKHHCTGAVWKRAFLLRCAWSYSHCPHAHSTARSAPPSIVIQRLGLAVVALVALLRIALGLRRRNQTRSLLGGSNGTVEVGQTFAQGVLQLSRGRDKAPKALNSPMTLKR